MLKNAANPADAVGANEEFEFDETIAEHISLGDEDNARRDQPPTLREEFELRDRFRHRETRIALYDQGFLRIIERRNGKQKRRHQLDLRYFDPTPVVSRHFPLRLMRATAAAGGLTLILGTLAGFGLLGLVTIPGSLILGTVTLIGLFVCLQMSHTRFAFYTLHGRAEVLRITAGFGCVGRYRKVLPSLINAIEDACNDISDDMLVYLRAEMREHYRLRSEGILSEADCSDSTSRILAHFDEPV
jgi:hypothetical protein